MQRRDGRNGGKVRGLLQNAYKGHKRGLYEGTGYSGYIRGTADTYGVQRIHTGYSVQQAGTISRRLAAGRHTAGPAGRHTAGPAGRHTAGPAGRTTYNGRL